MPFSFSFWILWIIGKCIALNSLDSLLELRKRRADVRKLDDIGFRGLGQLAQFRQRIGLLLFRRVVGEYTENAPG